MISLFMAACFFAAGKPRSRAGDLVESDMQLAKVKRMEGHVQQARKYESAANQIAKANGWPLPFVSADEK